MKKTIFNCHPFVMGSTRVKQKRSNGFRLRNAMLFIAMISFIISTGCNKDDDRHMPGNVLDKYTGLSQQTIQELKAAQTATERYKNIQNAIADGYADIEVVVEHMGFHYMKASLADTLFEYNKPEILVYNKNHEGQTELVAVEYAVPISLMPDTAPAGFTGSGDVWKYDTGFGLWLLHAWVWAYNPDGVFNPTNPSVHLH
ncbi:MAG TPA: hypothetical protein VFW07_17365 [Parafilimonas sp.]|nr:hypothetical protein [Parafilimonas sp.]